MTIHKIKGADRSIIITTLNTALNKSRFTAELYSSTHARYRECIEIKSVRLRERKPFCGNHPNACVGVGEKHRRTKLLEGADWVEFNDLINDVLDALDVAANVFSRPLELRQPLYIRRGGLRRMEYESKAIYNGLGIQGYVWLPGSLQESLYGDFRKEIAPRSLFPDGTPGINTGMDYAAVGHEEHQH